MKKNKIILFVSMFIFFLQSFSMDASAETNQIKNKAAQIKNKAAQIKNKIAQKKQIAPSSSLSKKTDSSFSEKDSAQVKQLIDDLAKAMEKITCSCGSSKTDKDGKSEGGEQRCQHDQDHNEKINKAYQIYEKLHKALDDQCLEQDDIKKVKPVIKKLFECKNIQKKPFHPKTCRVQAQ